jgi:hypothetical protein
VGREEGIAAYAVVLVSKKWKSGLIVEVEFT